MEKYFFISIGSNQGNSLAYLQQTLKALQKYIDLIQVSSVWRTQPWGVKEQPDFLNLVVGGKTTLTPQALLEICQKIENALGRIRKMHWGPRTIDIDLLSFDTDILQTPFLTLPHPLLQKRLFVLAPWNEIAPKYEVPLWNKTVQELFYLCKDESVIEKLESPLS